MDVTRIIDLPSKTYIEECDYIAIDNQQDGTQKVQFTNLFDNTLSQENKIAPANIVGNEIATIRAAVGSPLKASTVAQMTDTNKIYVYVGSESGYTNGNWYYWNSSAWVSGGVYNSVAVVTDPTLTLSGVPADAKATGDARVLLASRITTAESDIDILETHKVAQPLNEYNQPTNGVNGQSLRTKGDGTTEWADVGLPTDEQTAQAVSDWLDEHPEATTTVQDGSLTEAKFTDALKLKTIKDYVTPEMFGAKGDGTTDDTIAIQNAIDSNAKVIIFPSNIYKCGKITVDHNCIIDCCNAEFICTESVLFDCVGSVADSYSGNDYSLWQKGYALGSGDNYTGVVMLKGTNNAFHARTYYKGGFVGRAVNDILQSNYPIVASTVTIEEIDAICVYVCNIANVSFTNTNYSYVIKFTYNDGSIAENIKQHDSCYCVVGFESSINCTARNCAIICKAYSGDISYNYPIEIIDSSYCLVEKCDITNLVWHCITTGGNYLCYYNTIKDCVLHSSNGNPAFLDHDNGLGTHLYNNEISAVVIGALCEIDGLKIQSCSGVYNRADICLQATDEALIANYIVKNCNIIGVSGANADYCGIGLYISPQVSDSFEYQIKNVKIENVMCYGIALGRLNRRGSASLKVQNVSIDGINMMVLANIDNLYVKNMKKYDASHIPQLGGSGYAISNIDISNSEIGNIVGTVSNVKMTNCITDGTAIANSNPLYMIINSSIRFDKSVSMGGKVFAKNCIISGSATPYDIIGVSGVGYYGQYSANGYSLTQIS